MSLVFNAQHQVTTVPSHHLAKSCGERGETRCVHCVLIFGCTTSVGIPKEWAWALLQAHNSPISTSIVGKGTKRAVLGTNILCPGELCLVVEICNPCGLYYSFVRCVLNSWCTYSVVTGGYPDIVSYMMYSIRRAVFVTMNTLLLVKYVFLSSNPKTSR